MFVVSKKFHGLLNSKENSYFVIYSFFRSLDWVSFHDISEASFRDFFTFWSHIIYTFYKQTIINTLIASFIVFPLFQNSAWVRSSCIVYVNKIRTTLSLGQTPAGFCHWKLLGITFQLKAFLKSSICKRPTHLLFEMWICCINYYPT